MAVELDVVDDVSGENVRDTFPHEELGVDHVVCADAFEDLAVLAGDGLGPDVVHARFGESEHGEHAGFDVCTHRDHGAIEVADAELAKGLLVGAVGLDDVGQRVGPLRDQCGVLLDGQDFLAEADEGIPRRRI